MIVPLPSASSYTVPLPLAPPLGVVPYRSPAASANRPESGLAPLVESNNASVVIVPLPLATSNREPNGFAVPPEVTPYRSPAASAMTPAGACPLTPSNDASGVIVPLPLATSNTSPWPLPPPLAVDPYRLPAASATRSPYGRWPSVPSNVASVVTVPLPLAISNTVPSPPVSLTNSRVAPYRLPAASATRPVRGRVPSSVLANVASVASVADNNCRRSSRSRPAAARRRAAGAESVRRTWAMAKPRAGAVATVGRSRRAGRVADPRPRGPARTARATREASVRKHNRRPRPLSNPDPFCDRLWRAGRASPGGEGRDRGGPGRRSATRSGRRCSTPPAPTVGRRRSGWERR